MTFKKDFKYVRLVENYDNQPNLFLFTEYTAAGKLTMRAISSKKDIPHFEGPRIEYYENGNKKQESNYVDNKLIGTHTNWYENGSKKLEGQYVEDTKNKTVLLKINEFWDAAGVQKATNGNGEYEENNETTIGYGNTKYYAHGTIKNGLKDGVWQGWTEKPEIKFTEEYKDGQFISGKISDEKNIETTYTVLEKKPEPKKGMAGFYQYIGSHYRTPQVQGLKGKIYVKFIVDTDGKIVEPQVLRDIGYGTGEEAVRILKDYKDFIPGERRGRKVRVMYSLPITIQASDPPQPAYNPFPNNSNPYQSQNNNPYR